MKCCRTASYLAVCMLSTRRLLLGEIQPLLRNRSHELKRLMEDHGIEELPETEEVWEVPEPKIILPPKPSM